MAESRKRWSGWIALGIAAALFVGVVVMARAELAAPRPLISLSTIVIVGMLGFAAAAWGLVRLGARSRQLVDGDPARGDYSHVVRLVGVLAVGGMVAAIARYLLIPVSHGEFGYYRGNAPREAMSAEVEHVGKERCRLCHPVVPKNHAKDVHASVQCESCHGAAAEHLAHFEKEGLAAPTAIFVPSTKEPCLWCHRRLAARPSAFPQVDPVEHYAFLGVGDPDTPCMKCHNPHEPLFLDRPLDQARLHPVIQRCRDCHDEPPSVDAKKPDDHPVMFACSYCHERLAQDFTTRPHRSLECERCHQVHRASPTAMRIVKHRDPRFCLLCHEKKPFRNQAAPPLVSWPSHGQGGGKTCLDCHENAIHGAKAATQPVEAP